MKKKIIRVVATMLLSVALLSGMVVHMAIQPVSAAEILEERVTCSHLDSSSRGERYSYPNISTVNHQKKTTAFWHCNTCNTDYVTETTVTEAHNSGTTPTHPCECGYRPPEH